MAIDGNNISLTNTTDRNATDIELDTSELVIWCALLGIKILTYLIGVALHIKIILISIREKDLTWKMDITNSFISIVHFTHVLFLYLITNAVEDLYTYTGKWFCYAAREVRYYGYLSITGYSLIVSILKYVLIVHREKARDFGKNKVKELLFWINILHPLLTITLMCLNTPDYLTTWDRYKEIDLCLGDPKNNWGPGRNHSQTKSHNVCLILSTAEHENVLDYLIKICRVGFCWFQVIYVFLIGWNFLEYMIYCAIFGSMRR